MVEHSGTGLLLAIDGDSLAHRAYHGLPKTIRSKTGRPSNALVGFGGFLIALWESERPAAVLVGFDTLEVPTSRSLALPGYQAGRAFDEEIVEQLGRLPELIESFGFAVAKAPGFEADDFLAAASAAWEGPVSVVTSDRDAYQLVDERVTVLQPRKGVGELARIDPAGVRERYGVEPAQVPDFIALRGDPSDRIPGVPGVGPKKAAQLLGGYGTIEGLLAAGRYADMADDLRLYRAVAQMDVHAPIPPIRARPPDWEGAAAKARSLGLEGLAGRLAERA